MRPFGSTLAAILLLNYLLWLTRGMYNPAVLLLAGMLGATVFFSAKSTRAFPAPAIAEIALLGVITFNLHLLVQSPRILYGEHPGIASVLSWTLIGGFALSLGLFATAIARRPREGRFRSVALVMLLGALLLVRFLVPLLSPAPHIDVFTSNTQAADYLLAGRNPYGGAYRDIYGGGYDYPPGVPYFPGVVYASAIARALTGDIRWGLFAAELLACLLLWRLSARFALSRTTRQAWLLAWVSHPAALFVLEQSWVDALMLPLIAALAMFPGAIPAALLCAGLLTIKQYAVPLVLLTGAAVVARDGARRAGIAALAGAALFCALFLPLPLLDPAGFVRMTIETPIAQGTRLDSLSLVALWTNRTGIAWPGWLSALAGLLVLATAVRATARRAGDTLAVWSLGNLAVYAVVFLLGKQAFCNYYYFMELFLHVHLLALLAPPLARPVTLPGRPG